MKKILFASDLDNTLLFSYKHKKEGDICVEYLDKVAQGFCTIKSLELLEIVNKNALFIPITSRSIQQYKRINFPKPCIPEYALTTNGAILLKNGKIDEEWIEESKEMVTPWLDELYKLEESMTEIDEILRHRLIDDMYLFAACENSEDAWIGKNHLQNKTKLDIFVSGRKIYIFPPGIDKGTALNRLRCKFDSEKVFSAGDSKIDIPMLNSADIAIFPNDIQCSNPKKFVWEKSQGVNGFPEFVLKSVVYEIKE